MRNNMTGYKRMIHTLRVLIHFIICIQLILYPTWSFSAEDSTSSKPSDSVSLNDNNVEAELQKAQQFNEEVVSLYDHVLGRREKSEYYKNHPLDVYGLIGQEVRPYQYRELTDKERDKIAFSTTESNYQERKKNYYHTYPLLEERIAERLFGKKEEVSQSENSSEEKELSEVEMKAKAEAEKEARKNPLAPYRQSIPIDHVFVEVVDEKGEVRAILNTHGEKINPLVFSDASKFGWVDRSLYNGHSYTAKGEGKYQFRISYREQILHIFPNHINWISLFGPYIVFMQPSQVYEKGRAMPSFIDLQFFQQNLNRTKLPLFRTPAKIDTKQKREILLNPVNISIEDINVSEANTAQEPALRVIRGNKPYTLAQSELVDLSSVQQMFFNVMVSIISIKNYDADVIPFVQDIIQKVEQLTKEIANSEGKDYTESINILRDILSARLQQRSTIGSPNDRTGVYGQWVSAQDRLNRNQERLGAAGKDIRETLIESLEKDTEFQQAVSLTSAEHAKRDGVLRRLQALYLQLTKPKPWGVPKIVEGLGLIAGSLRPGENVSHRGNKLMEGLEQVFASRGGRIGSTALMAGLLGIASPEVAQFYYEVFSFGKEWVSVTFDTTVRSADTATVWARDPSIINESYIANERAGKTAEGVGAILGVIFLLFGSMHMVMNRLDFIRYSKSQKAQAHQNEVRSFRQRFIDWEQRTINDFNENLIKAELRKIGLPVEIHLPGNRVLKMVFQTDNRWSRLIDNYSKRNNNIELHFHINNGAEVISLLSSQEALKSDVEDQRKMELILKPSTSARARGKSRTFILQEGSFADLFKNVESLKLSDSIEMELSAKNRNQESVFHYKGDISDANFSDEENERVRQALIEAETAKHNRSLLKRALRRIRKSEQEQATAVAQTKALSQTQINSFAKAVLYSWSFSNWATTFSSMILYWNRWFKFRTLLMSRPSVSLRVAFFNDYFDRVHNDRHVASVLNGGMTSRQRMRREQKQEREFGTEYLSALKSFEEQIVIIERQYIRASAEEAYLLSLEMYTDPKTDEAVRKELEKVLQSGVARESSFKAGAIQELGLKIDESTDNFSLNLNRGKVWERSNRKVVFLMEFFQRTLRKEAIRDLLKEKLGVSDQNLSDWKIREMVMERAQKGESLDFFSEEEDLARVRQRVRTVSDRLNLKETVVKSMGKFYKEFFNKWGVYSEMRGERKLDPLKNLSMGRYKVANDSLKDPEALARAVKSQIVETIVDKPLELFLMFLVLAGVDYGILQVIHDERFSEEAIFYTSRFAVWSGYIAGIIMSVLGDAWFKVQQDARLGVQGGFERVPTAEDVNKRFAGFKWYYLEGFRRPADNKTMPNYRFTWNIAFANFKAAIPTFAIIHFATLGRFDIEFFMGAYIGALIFLTAFHYKLENVFEKSINLALRPLIRAGLNLEGKDKKLLTHIDVVRYKLNQSFWDRMKFNLMAHSVLNPVYSIFDILQTIETSWGSRGISRILGAGNSLTEYWVELMNKAHENGLMSRGVANACKKVFTRNRTDIIE